MPFLAQLGEMKVEPYGIVPRLSSGELTAEEWREQSATIGFPDLDLAKVDEN